MSKVNISGKFGPGVVVKSGDRTAINIAGGSGSGDVYQESSEAKRDFFREARRAVRSLPISDDDKDRLDGVVLKIEGEAGKGAYAEAGLVDYLLSGVRENAPSILELLAMGILDRSSAPQMRRLAQQIVESLRPSL
jgi:hypothetical protein